MTAADPPIRCRHRWHAGQIHTCWQPPGHLDAHRCRCGATTANTLHHIRTVRPGTPTCTKER